MILADSATLEPFQELVSAVLATRLGRHLEIPYSYLAMTRRSHYLGSHKHPGQEAEGEQPPAEQAKYMFVYPFVKKRSWYGLPFAERQRIMGEHFKVGRKYPKIKINTGYSFGLDDQEFVLAFEGDDPGRVLGPRRGAQGHGGEQVHGAGDADLHLRQDRRRPSSSGSLVSTSAARWQGGGPKTWRRKLRRRARARSEALFARARKVMVGGVSSPVRAFKAVGGTPALHLARERARTSGAPTAPATSTTSALGGR